MTTARNIGLAIEDLSGYYGNFRVLKNVTLQIPSNKVTALIGPSGSGKSTLLRCFNRMYDLIPCARIEGKVYFGENNIYAAGVDPTEVGTASTLAYGGKAAGLAVPHGGWVGIKTYNDNAGNLRVKSEVLVAASTIAGTDSGDDTFFKDA